MKIYRGRTGSLKSVPFCFGTPIFPAILMVLGIFGAAAAQEWSTVINSNPPGAAVQLDGEYRITATTPCRLPSNVTGFYKLTASMPGFETWSGEMMIMPDQDNTISFSLSPRTRVKAGLRSLFIPGWGQYYSRNRTKAFVFGLSTLGAGIASLALNEDLRIKRRDYNQAMTDLANASSAEEILSLSNLVNERFRDMDNAESDRNLLIAVTAGLWAYNVLDALIFFPQHKLTSHKTDSEFTPRIEADFREGRTTLKLVAAF